MSEIINNREQRTNSELFSGVNEEFNQSVKPEDQPGHPIHTFKMENREIDKLIKFKIKVHLEQFEKEDNIENIAELLKDITLLLDIDKHYSRKENLIFPYLEKYGIYGPTQICGEWMISFGITSNILKKY